MTIGPNTAAVLRAYATSRDKLPKLTKELSKSVAALRGKVQHVRIAVWVNPHYPGADFGGSAQHLANVFENDPFVSVKVAGGDIFVGVLNDSLRDLYETRGYGYTSGILVLSATAHHLLTPKVAEAMSTAIDNGALAVGVVSPDNPITLDGAISNTCAWWDVIALLKSGGFNGIDARPPDFDYKLHHQGVAELANLFALGDDEGVLAVIIPDVEEGDARTVASDPVQLEKLANKERRMFVTLAILGKSLDDLRAKIRKGYPLDLRSPR